MHLLFWSCLVVFSIVSSTFPERHVGKTHGTHPHSGAKEEKALMKKRLDRLHAEEKADIEDGVSRDRQAYREDKAERDESLQRNGRYHRAERGERDLSIERGGRSERAERSERGVRSEYAEMMERVDRDAEEDRVSRLEQDERNERLANAMSRAYLDGFKRYQREETGYKNDAKERVHQKERRARHNKLLEKTATHGQDEVAVAESVNEFENL